MLGDDVAGRGLDAADNAQGDHLTIIAGLSPKDLSALLNVVDGVVAKSPLRAMAGDLG